MASHAVSLLALVVAGLEARQLDAERASQIMVAAAQLDATEAEVWTQLSGKQQRKLRQLLRQLAQRAAQLSSRLTDAQVAAADLVLRTQVYATCTAVSAGLRAMQDLQLEADEAFNLCSALALVLRAGSSCAAADCGWWIAQLEAVAIAATLQPVGSEAAAKFAGTAARPEALLPWMADAARALGADLHESMAGKKVRCHAATRFAYLAGAVVVEARYAKHQAALAANPALARPLAAFLLRHCLPVVAEQAAGKRAGAEAKLLRLLMAALNAPCLTAAADSHLQQPANAAAVAQLAASLVSRLPAPAQPGTANEELVEGYSQAASLLARPCFALVGLLAGAEVVGQDVNPRGTGSSSSSSSRRASGGSDGSSMSGSSSGGSSSGSGDVDGSSSGGSSNGASPASMHSELASRVACLKATSEALLGALPKLAAFIAAAAAEGSPLLQPVAGGSSGLAAAARRYSHEAMQHNLACMMNSLGHAVGLNNAVACYLAHPPEFHLWIDAAEAAVRLQPTLMQLQCCPGLASPAVAEQARWFAQRLLGFVWGLSRPTMVPLGPLADEAAAAQRASLGNRLWQLHSTSCRWIHSLLAEERRGSGRIQACQDLKGGRIWGALLFSLNLIFHRAYDTMHSHEADEPLGPTAASQLAALCAAHWEAVRGLAAAAEPDGGLALATADEFTLLHRAYHRIATKCPFLATPTFFQPLLQAMHRARGTLPVPIGGSTEVLLAAAGHPQVAAAVMASGLVGIAAADAAQFAADPNVPDAATNAIHQLLDQAERTMLCLQQGALEASRSLAASSTDADRVGSEGSGGGASGGSVGNGSLADGSGSSSGSGDGSGLAGSTGEEAAVERPISLGDMLEAAGLLLRHLTQRQEQSAADRGSPSLADRAKAVQERLPFAHAAASKLNEYFSMPQQAAAARTAAAQAAAARSCANFACPNLECGGGPGAHQGTSSRKCSACRAVRYCGTACSHADWKAGHRRTCKALAAARLERVQQGDKPRRTADAGAEEGCWQGSGFVMLGIKV